MALPSVLRQRLRLPVIGAPLFIVSSPDLVIAQCKAGVVGAFPALNARPAPALGEWLERITTELGEHDKSHPGQPSAPFAVNQIVHKSNDRLSNDLDVCLEYQVPIVITSLGAREDVNRAVHPTKMNFGSGSESINKAWRDIWGSGQGIGSVKRVEPVATFVDRLAREYADAKARLGFAANEPMPAKAVVG